MKKSQKPFLFPVTRCHSRALALAASVVFISGLNAEEKPAGAQSTSPTLATPAVSVSPAKPSPPPRTPESAVTPTVKDPRRHEQFLNRIKEGDINLLFVGDSITDFWNRVGEKSWLNFAPYKPANIGISGDETQHVLWRLLHGELDNMKPKVAVVMIGTNNFGHYPDEKPEWVANGVKKIVDTIHEKLPQTKVLLLGIFPRDTPNSHYRTLIAETNRIISSYDDGAKTRYLDIGKVFLDAQGNLPPDIMPDKLHPSAFGYDRWYDAMHPLLDEMMK